MGVLRLIVVVAPATGCEPVHEPAPALAVQLVTLLLYHVSCEVPPGATLGGEAEIPKTGLEALDKEVGEVTTPEEFTRRVELACGRERIKSVVVLF